MRKTAWQLQCSQPWAEFAAAARRRAGLDSAGWEQVLWHGGLFLGRARVDGSCKPPAVAAGTWVRVYAFVEPPAAVHLSPSVILLQRAGIIAIDKPAGLVVQGTRASWRLCVEAALRELCRETWLYAAHRLDRGTSGVLLFATSPAAFAHVQRQFAHRRVRKRYLAWVEPVPTARRWTVEGWLVRVPHPEHACYALRPTSSEGRFSATRFELLRSDGGRALVAAEPTTGRTHQIRVHLAAGGTPIIGDGLYGPGPGAAGAGVRAAAQEEGIGGPVADRAATEQQPAPRLCLHAAALQVQLPGEDDPRWIRAAPPADFGPVPRR